MEKEELLTKKEEDILILIKKLSRKLRKRFDEKLQDLDLTSQQGRVLCFISKNYENKVEIHQRDIEQNFELTKSTVSGLVERLEKKGLITRRCVKTHVVIEPTEKGRNVIKDIQIGKVETINKLLGGFSEQEANLLINTIKKLYENIKEDDQDA